MSTDVRIGANQSGEAYIGLQDDTLASQPTITAWNPPGDKRQNQSGTTLVGTSFDLT